MPRYEERLAAYNAAHGLSTPRRTIPGWMLFRMRTGLCGKELSEVWASMTEEEKKVLLRFNLLLRMLCSLICCMLALARRITNHESRIQDQKTRI